jgi:hypothetical protein
LVTNTEISPLVPDGTIAAFAVTAPVVAFKVDTSGMGCPAGQVLRKPRLPLGTEVKLREYAFAVAGMPHGLERMGNVLVAFPIRDGPPSAPAALRVSTRRQGATG